MKRKWISLLLVAALVSTMCAGCTSGEASKNPSENATEKDPENGAQSGAGDTEEESETRDPNAVYDEAGKLVKEPIYAYNGNILGWTEYEYDSNGNKIKGVSYDEEKNITDEYEYDARGNVVKHTGYDIYEGYVEFCEVYEYSSSGEKIKSVKEYYNKRGKVIEKEEYDANDNMLKETSFDEYGNLTEEREYDIHGRVQKYTTVTLSGAWIKFEVFDGNDNCLESKVTGVNGEFGNWHRYEYNSDGEMIKDSSYDKDNNLIGYTICKYEYVPYLSPTIYWFFYDKDGKFIAGEKSYQIEENAWTCIKIDENGNPIE